MGSDESNFTLLPPRPQILFQPEQRLVSASGGLPRRLPAKGGTELGPARRLPPGAHAPPPPLGAASAPPRLCHLKAGAPSKKTFCSGNLSPLSWQTGSTDCTLHHPPPTSVSPPAPHTHTHIHTHRHTHRHTHAPRFLPNLQGRGKKAMEYFQDPRLSLGHSPGAPLQGWGWGFKMPPTCSTTHPSDLRHTQF